MPRFAVFAALSLTAGALLIASAFVACNAADLGLFEDASANARKDGAPVDPLDSGTVPPEGPSRPSCATYCGLVMSHCTGDQAQYASADDCLAFCRYLPETGPTRGDTDTTSASLACRQYWAGSPARTDPASACLAAGPFGANVCGQRCTAFCDVLLGACGNLGPSAPFADQPECASACADLTFRDAGADGGGEGPDGPDAGDSLNCRLFVLRQAAADTQACPLLAPDAGACR